MNLFNNIRQNYGQTTVKQFRHLENSEKKIQRHRNHLVYTLRCRDLDLTPSSLKLRSPINTKQAKDIIKRAQKGLVRERIRVINNKLASLKNQRNRFEDEVNKKIPAESPLRKLTIDHIATVKETTYQNTKTRHLKKLQNLEDKSAAAKRRSPNSTPDLTGTQMVPVTLLHHKAHHIPPCAT